MALGTDQPSDRRALRTDFGDTTSTAQERAAGHPAALKLLSAINSRAYAVRQRAIAHHKACEDRWTAKEAMHLWKRLLTENARFPGPPGVKQDVAPEAVMKMAARNVRARTVARLSRINAIKTRMSNAVARNLDTPRMRRDFSDAAPEQRPNIAPAIPSIRRRQ